MDKFKLAILTSHPIQYQAPLFRKLATNPGIDLMVYFCWDFGVRNVYDVEFGKEIKWDIPLLDGYKYRFLRNLSLRPSSDFWGQINPSVMQEIKRGGYDALMAFGWNAFTNWLAFFACFLYGVPLFMRGENPLNQELLKPRWKIKIKKIVLGWLFRRSKGFLYIGEENRKFYKYYGVPDSKLFFAPYAVDNDRFMEAAKTLKPKRRGLRSNLGIGASDVAVLFIGKLIEKKRPADLLRAYEKLMTNYDKSQPVIHLLFVGDGKLRPGLEGYVKERRLPNVHFVGFKNQSEVPAYYAIADILVLPSESGETWGLIVNEAMCFGLPIIVSDLVGCGPDLVRNGKNGYIFPCRDVSALTQLLEGLIADKERRNIFGSKSLDIIREYSYENDIKAIEQALKN